MNFNLKKIIVGTLVMVTLLPSLAFADNSNGRSDNKKEQKSSINFCSRISNLPIKTAEQITKAEEKQSKNQSEKLSKIENKQSDADEKRLNHRTNTDSKRLSNWNKIENKAKTDAQKVAVETYKQIVQDAVNTRRTGIDNAIKTYRDGLAQILGTNSDTINQALEVFKSSVNVAVVKAQTDCAANVDSNTVKNTFNQSIKNAREILKTSRKNMDMSPAVKALKKTRDDSINAIVATFKTTTEKARADLLLALK